MDRWMFFLGNIFFWARPFFCFEKLWSTATYGNTLFLEFLEALFVCDFFERCFFWAPFFETEELDYMIFDFHVTFFWGLFLSQALFVVLVESVTFFWCVMTFCWRCFRTDWTLCQFFFLAGTCFCMCFFFWTIYFGGDTRFFVRSRIIFFWWKLSDLMGERHRPALCCERKIFVCF